MSSWKIMIIGIQGGGSKEAGYILQMQKARNSLVVKRLQPLH
jgi:hypothetical protein